MNKLILCADDYAQDDAISRGIRKAMRARRLNATSCLVNAPSWPEAGEALRVMNDPCMVGLHLNFTWGKALSEAWQHAYGEVFPSLWRVIQKNYVSQLDEDVVKAECHAQLHAFCEVMHRYPDFIDGHQHVQQLPVIRQALLSIYAEERLTSFLRVSRRTSQTPWYKTCGFFKLQIMTCLGGEALWRSANAQRLQTPASFSGVYPFRHASDYRAYFKRFLAMSMDGGLIMCHPGLQSGHQDDPLCAPRHQELAYLMSEDFLHDLDTYGFTLEMS